ncbi:MAG: family 16 glycosylhydrolase [Brumimicrobium sp.]
MKTHTNKIQLLTYYVTIFCYLVSNTSSAQSWSICQGNGQQVVLSNDGECNYDEYVLVFEDNFNGNSLDLEKWKIPHQGVVNDLDFETAKSWYANTGSTPSIPINNNIVVSNGTLKLISKKENPPIEGTYVTDWSTSPPTTNTDLFDYSTSWIESTKKFEHGIYEIKCKIPEGKGFWPAFWTYSDHGDGTGWNEIDVFEFYSKPNTNNPSKVHRMNNHYDYDDIGENYNCPTNYEGSDFSQAFHTFTLVWTPNKIEWYVDGDLKRRTTLFYTIQGQTVDCNTLQAFQPYILDKAFPRDPMNIIASVGIQTGVNAPNQNTSFPSNFEIDYIKYYKQIPCEGLMYLDDIADLNLDPEIYNVIVGTTINLSDNFTLPSDQQLAIIASNEINLSSNNTNIELGSNFDAIIDNSICQNINKTAINENQSASNKFNPNVDSAYNETPFKIYPNPNDGRFFVVFIPDLSQSYKIYVINNNGKIIYDESDIKQSKIEVNLSNQKAGVFSLYVVDSSREKVYTHKIIKSK